MNYREDANINPLMKNKITLVAAINKGGWIAKEGKQVWVNSHDRQRFRRLTTGHTVIYGRKTYESMGSKPLPDRVNIVISKTLDKRTPGIRVARSASEAIQIYNAHGKNNIFVIGGGEIFKLFYPFSGVILLTQAEDETVGDVGLGFQIEEGKWRVGSVMDINRKSGDLILPSHKYITLERLPEVIPDAEKH